MDPKPTTAYLEKRLVIPFPNYDEAIRCKRELDILATVEGYLTVADFFQFSYPGRWKCTYDEWHIGWSKEDIFEAGIKVYERTRDGDLYFIDLPIARRISHILNKKIGQPIVPQDYWEKQKHESRCQL